LIVQQEAIDSSREAYDDSFLESILAGRRKIWADVICINQDYLGEQARQIMLMSCIYTNAGHLVVWLGLEKDDNNFAMKFVTDFSKADFTKQKTWTIMVRTDALFLRTNESPNQTVIEKIV
jgi:hypothetical protein